MNHVQARSILVPAFRSVMGRDPTIPEIQYAHAIGVIETSYGQGWNPKTHPQMVGSNNWGAVSCKVGSPGCIPGATDSFPDGTKYQTGMRGYPTPEAGAADMIRNIFKVRPRTASVFRESDPLVFRASYAMRRERYYGGFCNKATAQYGGEPARASFQNPDRDEGTRACAREAISLHGNRAAQIIKEVAAQNNDPSVMNAGSYDDADAWWNGQPTSGGAGGGGGLLVGGLCTAAFAGLAVMAVRGEGWLRSRLAR